MFNTARGSALLSALFLMTLVAIAATAMSTRLQLDIYRTRLSIESDKVNLASQAVAFWAMDSLVNPKTQLTPLDEAGRVLNYPKLLKTIYPAISLDGQLYDLQARFNLNNMTDVLYQSVFLSLLKNNVKDAELNTLKYIRAATVNWVSVYRPSAGFDEWMTYYSQQKPPYLPAWQPMQSVSEFRMVAGVTAKIYQSVVSLITALPTQTAINLNTASKKVLMALGDGLSEQQVEELLQMRQEKGLLMPSDIEIMIKKFNIPAKQISVESDYYLSVATATSTDLTIKHYTVLHRTKDRQGRLSVSILSETLNAY